MRSVFLILFLVFYSNSFTQKSNNRSYLELNSGIAVFEEFSSFGPSGGFFPGISFLIGNQSFIFQNIFFESQIGLALPSIVTAKIGLGFINKGIGASIGMRLYPTMGYAQIHLPTSNGQFNISAEVSPGVFIDQFDNFYSLGARNIFALGYQWNIGNSRKR
ncbi:MAG: hypothetical protein NTY55_10405 [Flavobacteriia bacterium]|nr:hypothetical protein [Flavobacteriia bacterium]